MADRKVSELNAATAGNLHDAALLHVVDLLEAAAADQNVKATIAQLKDSFLTSFYGQGSASSKMVALYVEIGGALNTPLAGWGAEKLVGGAGEYRVTHPLGTADLTIIITTQHHNGTPHIAVVEAITTTTFDYRTWLVANPPLDNDSACHILVISR